ncbi:MAG TPA: family 78 glycoside hydrolase catalytic domain [Puia sp.]
MRRLLYHIALFTTITVKATQPIALQCEQLVNPQGIDTRLPRLSWQLSAEGNDIEQTAWQILVASTPEILAKDKGDCWTSPKTVSDQSRMIPYAGKPVVSGHNYYWKVKVWTNTGASQWSTPAHWSMGLLHPADWKAKWIGYDNSFPWDSVSKFSRLSARYFRKEFKAANPIKHATLYIAGLGHYLVAINGQAIGDLVLAEPPTDYTKNVKYNSYDVTAACRKGANAIGVTLGNGRFFTMRPKYKPQKIKEFGFPKLLLQLDLEDEKGQHRLITSDDSWRFTADGPIRTNNEYDGEEYDATKEFPRWTNPGFDDTRWLKPQYTSSPGGRLTAQMNEPLRIMQTIHAVSIKPLNASTVILDMGQNMAGWLQLKVKGQRGQTITLRFAETLKPDGDLYTANLRDAKVTDSYTLKGGGEETWHPVFVFHGFRYVAVTGYPGTPAPDDFEGQVVYDDLATIGQIETSDTLLNHIVKNAWWGINANYKGMPIDCPQRNERMPWLGDRATGSLGESYLFANGNLYAKWLNDIEESQKPNGSLPDVAPAYWNYYSDNMTWPGTYLLVADMLYNQFGDPRPIQKHYASMQRWIHYMSAKYEHDGLMTKDKYGDWCVPPESPQLIHSRDSLRTTDGTLIATAYYYHLLTLMQKFAALLHQPDTFAKHAAAAKAAFNKHFLNKDHYSNNSATANLLPLYFGITPESDRSAVIQQLVDKLAQNNNHISTGVIGTQWLMRGLTEWDHADLAAQIATNKDYPSWGYMAEHGATTIWELWNGNTADPAMNSQNHIMLLGDLLTWCFEDLAGIAPAEPGFKKIRLHPVFPKKLDSVKAAYASPYGMIISEWRRVGNTINWEFTIPPNTSAILDDKTTVGSGTHRLIIKNDKSI